MELLAPVGAPQSVEAAVQSGANAIYLGYGQFNARRNAKNFSLEELETAVDYCHIRGVSVFLTLNTLLTQRELQQGEALVAQVAEIGIDAVIVQDMGVAEMVRQVAPTLERHASTQTTAHSLDGVKKLAELGFSRVVLARELGRSELEYIAARSPVELEVFVHGAQCMSYSGQCYLSAVVGQRSGNRGVCAQPCRLPYQWKGAKQEQGKHPMSLKDMSLANHVQELEQMGITSLKIEGRMKRPEYVAVVTHIYSMALTQGRNPTVEEWKQLELAFSREGFTQGYYEEGVGKDMFGIRGEGGSSTEEKELFHTARQRYENKELRKVPVFATIDVDDQFSLTLEDAHNNVVQGAIGVEQAKNKPLTPQVVEEQLKRTGGTPYTIAVQQCQIAPEKALPLSQVNSLRRELLEQLSEKRKNQYKREDIGVFSPIVNVKSNAQKELAFTVWVASSAQITKELLEENIALLYIPLDTPQEVIDLAKQYQVPLCVSVPSIASDKERKQLQPRLLQLYNSGVTQALVGTLDSWCYGQRLGFDLRGDYNLNFYNNHSLEQATSLLSAMPSFELKFSQIRDVVSPVPLEVWIYGHLPLMTTKNCMISNEFSGKNRVEKKGRVCAEKNTVCSKGKCKENMVLIDRKGEEFPVEQAYGGRNTVYNGKPLYLGDKLEDVKQCGVWAGRFHFSRETPKDCVRILREYKNNKPNLPEQFTRGLYYRGVE